LLIKKMIKNKKILIIGFGSIGQRHWRNLLNLGYKNIYVYDTDESRIKNYELPACKASLRADRRIKNINVNNLKQFNVVFVCNPNNMHIKTALLAAKAGCHLFIEKPLSHNLKNLDKLRRICRQKKVIAMVACNMRFHPCLAFIKKYLSKGKLGKVYSISHEFGYYLPYWRPGQDYRKNYAARKEMGGGIILDDIHEFDLLFWLNNFAKIKEAKFIYNKTSDLKINTEDNCIATFEFNNKVLGLVKCDYLQQVYSRHCKIVGENGNLEWDFNENIVWLQRRGSRQKLFTKAKYNLNTMYIEELKYFFNCLAKKQKTFNDIEIASRVLKYCLERK